MSAYLDLCGEVHHERAMAALKLENQLLREQLQRRGIDPDMLLAAIVEVRRRKKRKVAGN